MWLMPYHLRTVQGRSASLPAVGSGRSPFVPGWGKLPPYLAGRQVEQSVIGEFLDVLAERRAPDGGVILYGPRGNGKTALLRWARVEAEARGINVLPFSAAGIRTKESLANQLCRAPSWLRTLRRVSVGAIGAKSRDGNSRPVTDVLVRRAHKTSLLVTIDEAHVLAPGPGQAMLSAVQDTQGMGLAVLLILAGTPHLPRHLGTMDAPFWDRSERLPIGRLRRDAAAQAIRIPLEEHGRAMEDEALAQVVEESHGYPYFLQIWGKLLWQGSLDPSRPLSVADVDRVRKLFKRKRDLFYLDRHAELKERGLATVAAQVSKSFSGAPMRPTDEIEETVRSSLEIQGRPADRSSVTTACRRLYELGYIWSVTDQSRHCYEPGIPSLMAFVSRSECASDRTATP